MAVTLELADIQGNILAAYGRLGFPKGAHHPAATSPGRRKPAATCVETLRRRVTTALRWPNAKRRPMPGQVMPSAPAVTVNLAFTFRGLLALGVPIRTLRGMPDEFIDGMAARADILCDNFPRASRTPGTRSGCRPRRTRSATRRVHIAGPAERRRWTRRPARPRRSSSRSARRSWRMCSPGGVRILLKAIAAAIRAGRSFRRC